eukprot:1659479-Pyramimonas_sp.AAC.2
MVLLHAAHGRMGALCLACTGSVAIHKHICDAGRGLVGWCSANVKKWHETVSLARNRYYGTVVGGMRQESGLDVMHWWMDDPQGSRGDYGTR